MVTTGKSSTTYVGSSQTHSCSRRGSNCLLWCSDVDCL